MSDSASSADGVKEQLYRKLESIEQNLVDVNSKLKLLKEKKQALLEQRVQVQRTIDNQNATRSCSEAWTKETFSWSSQVRSLLQGTFNLVDFRDLQLCAINALLSGEDVILVMPTGGGKSLCYWLPAVYHDFGFALVISPLVSLMHDQVSALQLLGVGAEMLSADKDKKEVKRIESAMIDSKDKSLKLLFVTPEKLSKSKRFMNKLEKAHSLNKLKLIAIDEVHCLSSWGNDFRPDYKFLNILRRQYAGTPIIGVTATAPANVVEDVKDGLNLQTALVFRSSINRSNLFYEVRQKLRSEGEQISDIAKLIHTRFPNQSGIVYCFSRKDAESVSSGLRKSGIKSSFYHAQLSDDDRRVVHNLWISRALQVIVATVAFGMGIDKPDVRFVIHHTISKSIENYYQESGRAGRDGLEAHCILYYGYDDVFKQASMVCTERCGVKNLLNILGYCVTRTCRRHVIIEHFSEDCHKVQCNSRCDNCSESPHNPCNVPLAEYASSIMDIVPTSKDDRITGPKLVKLLCGKSKKLCLETAERIIAEMFLQNYLELQFHFTPYSIIVYVGKTQLLDAFVLQQRTTEQVGVPSKKIKLSAVVI